MRLTEIDAEEYKGLFGNPLHVFDTVGFSELNRHKVKSLRYLAFSDTKVRAGIVAGERADGLFSPFSAPFGGFSVRGRQRLSCMYECASLLKDYARQSGLPFFVTLPPLVYDVSQLSKWVNVLQCCGRTVCVDLNYHFDLPLFQSYEEHIERNARKNLHHALAEDLVLVKLDSSCYDDVERAYRVISENRREHGYPLRMSLQEVISTVKIVPADFFVMTHDGIDVAAAQIYRVAAGVAQVIYWGDLRAYSRLRTMNALAYRLFEYYSSSGMKVLDIGPSTENGVPNHGLCEFKEGIGCSVTPKFHFLL